MVTSPKFPSVDDKEIAALLRRWFNAPAGKDIRAAELALTSAILPNLFGYHIVQLGSDVADSFITTTRISHAVLIGNDVGGEQRTDIVGRCDALPLAANSIDVMVVPHLLEFASEPHAVLREAERVLIGEGYIVIAGFNPWSLCGLWRILAGWRGRPPWCGQFLSVSRIKDWLKLLGFEIEFLKKTSFRPPFNRESINSRLKFMELMGAFCWPLFGNVYVVVAKKHVAAVTPLKASWQTRRRIMAGGVAEPTTRAPEITPSRRNRTQ
jgi:SAM-dependent methyltransferase